MSPILLLILIALGAYLIGAIPFGYLIAKLRGHDIFAEGSGNIGATNVARVLGRRFGVLVFVLDFAKGAVPVLLAEWLAGRALSEYAPEPYAVAAGLGAFLGHLFPVYLGFHGGKGVATGAGVFAVLVPGPALGALFTWIAVVVASRTVSVASLAALACLCLLQIALTPASFSGGQLLVTLFCLVAGALVVVRHRANLVRLYHGNENRLPETFAMQHFIKAVHILSLALWFGSSIFFVFIVTPSLFRTFEAQATEGARPPWFPLKGTIYAHADEAVNGPKEQGSRAAGAAVVPLFLWFFFTQGVCGILATATSLQWSSAQAPRVHRLRTSVLLIALITVLAGWPLERKVSELREPRNQATDAYLAKAAAATSQERDALREAMLAARREFGTWHTFSLLLSFVTMGLVTVGMARAARLPEEVKLGFGRNGSEAASQVPHQSSSAPSSSAPSPSS